MIRTKKNGTKKPSLLFVDHEFHRKTRSFHFLIDILEQDFDLKTVYIDPTQTQDLNALMDQSEYVVLAQMDFLTPHFIAAGKKVCVVQMYDGSAGLPNAHWQMNRQARYLNFSVALHARALAAGAESLLVRYFPDPSTFRPVEDFSTMRGFFWQRLPRSPVNLDSVSNMVGRQLQQLHVHTPADDDTPFDPETLATFACPVTTSDWFERHEDLISVLDQANVFFAPRLAEGIGHGFLEALAKGMIVIAYDKPTHNEYISDRVTGILYDNNVGELDFPDWEQEARVLSRNARAMVSSGFARWQASHRDIVDFVRSTPFPRMPAIPGITHALREIEQSYIAGLPTYAKALDKFARLRGVMSEWDQLEDEVSQAAPVEDADMQRDIHLFFGTGNARPFFGSGWSNSELTHTWAIAQDAELIFPVLRDTTVSRLLLEARALTNNELIIALNGVTAGRARIVGVFQSLEFVLETPLHLKAGDVLTITFSVAEKVVLNMNGESRPLQFALKSLNIGVSPDDHALGRDGGAHSAKRWWRGPLRRTQSHRVVQKRNGS